jgi:hypothetical protein
MKWTGQVLVKAGSAKALLVSYEGEEAWIPISIIDDDSEVFSPTQVGETAELVMPEWKAKKLGWT